MPTMHPQRRISLRVWACFIVSIGWPLTIMGCNGSEDAWASSSNLCSAECARTVLEVARCQLGLDPGQSHGVDFDSDGTTIESVRDAVAAEAERSGGSLDIIPQQRLLKFINGEDDVDYPIILVGEDGRLRLLLGAGYQAGHLFYHVFDSDDGLNLLGQEQLARRQPREAWIVRNDSSPGVPIHVGDGLVRLSRKWMNLGQVKPFTKATAAFTITNEGQVPIFISRPETSCGCTTAQVTQDRLAPGATHQLDAAIHVKEEPTFNHTVWVTLSDGTQRNSRRISLEVFGWQPRPMVVAPREVDFGNVRRGEPVTRVIRLTESATDRFRIQNVKVPAALIDHTVSTEQTSTGFANYRVQLQLTADGSTATGSHEYTVHILTDSELRPVVSIPIRYTVKPNVECVPQSVAFGVSDSGATLERRVRFVASGDEPFEVTVAESPQDCDASIQNSADGPTLIVKPTFEAPGPWSRVVHLTIETAAGLERVQIPCTAFVRPAKTEGGHSER